LTMLSLSVHPTVVAAGFIVCCRPAMVHRDMALRRHGITG
jgi:hypothetical protein